MEATVKKAIVLAAGFGTRLKPFTCATPKPLLPVWGEPMLARIVSLLRGHGVEDIVVNTHHLHEQVDDWCAANGCRASHEPEILGTGGVLNPLRKWIGEEDFFLVNGDIVVEGLDELDWSELFGRGGSSDVIATCLVAEEGPRTIEVEPGCRYVTNWKSDDAGCPGTFTYCGFARLSPEIFKYVAPTGFSSIVAAYEKAMSEGRFVKAASADGLMWTDAGTVDSYIGINRDGDDNAFADIPQVNAALKAANAGDHVEFIGARGSERVFFRCDKGVIVVYDDTTRTENGFYAAHARFLAERGVPVPSVLADLPDLKTTVMEWAGSERTMSFGDYSKVVEELAKFNALGSDPAIGSLTMTQPFDGDTWKWERDLFAKHCLGARFRLSMPAAVEKELERVAEILEMEPRALVHRDFQSTNILWGGDGNDADLKFIDFQGMRLGPAAYDLASLLYNPYTEIAEDERRELAALYAEKSGRSDIAKVLPFAAVQRLVQCLGAYGRLASVGQPQFGRHVMPALQHLLAAADEADLDAVGALAEDLIAKEGAFSAGK